MKKENNEIEEQTMNNTTRLTEISTLQKTNTYRTVHTPYIPDMHEQKSQKPTNIQKHSQLNEQQHTNTKVLSLKAGAYTLAKCALDPLKRNPREVIQFGY
jgi:hypothetical protein